MYGILCTHFSNVKNKVLYWLVKLWGKIKGTFFNHFFFCFPEIAGKTVFVFEFWFIQQVHWINGHDTTDHWINGLNNAHWMNSYAILLPFFQQNRLNKCHLLTDGWQVETITTFIYSETKIVHISITPHEKKTITLFVLHFFKNLDLWSEIVFFVLFDYSVLHRDSLQKVHAPMRSNCHGQINVGLVERSSQIVIYVR